MTLKPSTKIFTAAGGVIRWSRIHHVAHTEDGTGVVAWIAGQPIPLGGNTADVETELVRLADQRDRDAAERFGGPAEPWSGGDGQDGLRRATAELARRR